MKRQSIICYVVISSIRTRRYAKKILCITRGYKILLYMTSEKVFIFFVFVRVIIRVVYTRALLMAIVKKTKKNTLQFVGIRTIILSLLLLWYCRGPHCYYTGTFMLLFFFLSIFVSLLIFNRAIFNNNYYCSSRVLPRQRLTPSPQLHNNLFFT